MAGGDQLSAVPCHSRTSQWSAANDEANRQAEARFGYARAELFQFAGDREAVRRQTVEAALKGLESL